MSHILSDFASAFRRLGLIPPDKIAADGELHRYRSGPEHGLNGFYRLSVVPAHQGGEIGFGLIGCWKRDIKERWCSREPNTLQEPDRAAIRRVQTELKRAEERSANEAVRKAAAIWQAAIPAGPDHPYLAAKGIGPAGLRLHKGMLVVPAWREGKISSLQFIDADGSKRFLTGGKMDGAYASLSARNADRSRIVIAEGYATAASLHEAAGLPCVTAFNAGNLLNVARAIREKYPESTILIAADNDRFTVVRGAPLNVGVMRATEAAAAVGGLLAVPEFPEDDPGKQTDWNDYAARFGLPAVRERIEAAFAHKPARNDRPDETERLADDIRPPPEAPLDNRLAPIEPAGDCPAFGDWRARLVAGKEVAAGHPFPFDGKSKANAYLFVKHHERFSGVFAYNEFSDQIMVVRRPPWDIGREFAPRPIRDDDFFMLAAHLEYCQISVSKDTAADALVRVAKENAVNPPLEFLSRLEWDGRPRLDTWLGYYLGADEQPGEYLALVGSKWMIGAVSRVFRPGCKFDSVMILEGTQGLGKSMALRALATFGGEDFFLDSVGDIRSKDTLMTMQGKLIVEIAELASFKKTENEEIKAFITRQVDEYRPPYGRTVVRRPRYFVLAGSTNEVDEGYLTDDTGNRRYWPVKCKGIDFEAVERDAPQLWAEAVARYRTGERTWLTAEEAVSATRQQSDRFMEDAWHDRIQKIVKNELVVTVDEVLNRLEMKPKDISNLVKKRVKNTLRKLGWHETRRAGEGRAWRPIGREQREIWGDSDSDE